MELSVPDLAEEVLGYLADIDVYNDGPHMYSNYQKITAYVARLTEMRAHIALAEISGQADDELRRFRTMIIDPTLDRLKEIGNYESRKITAIGYEINLEGKR